MKGLSLSDTYKAEVGDAHVHAVCSLWIELFDTRLDRQRVARERERVCVCVCVREGERERERERERETLLGIRLVSATLSPRAPFQGEEERSRDWMRVVQTVRARSLSLSTQWHAPIVAWIPQLLVLPLLLLHMQKGVRPAKPRECLQPGLPALHFWQSPPLAPPACFLSVRDGTHT
jgi:hypothetical protein